MKKLIVLLIGAIAIAGLVMWTTQLSKNAKATDSSLIAFAVKDTSRVDKIEIYDSYKDLSMTLVRGYNGQWQDNEGNCVQQDIVKMMLETMVKITLKGYVPQGAMQNMKNLMMAKHKKVTIYQDGDWIKTWYIGHATQDHQGTHMLLETPDMKSDNPVIMGMKGFYGILEPRFFADPKRFACTDLFSYKRTELKSVTVTNRVQPDQSFKIVVNGSNHSVTSNGKQLTSINEDNLLFYLNGFENIHFNQPNYTLTEKQTDSLKRSAPDYELNIEALSSSFKLNLYRRPEPGVQQGDSIIWDKDYLWGVKPDGEVVRMQYYSIGPLIEGQTVFVNN